MKLTIAITALMYSAAEAFSPAFSSDRFTSRLASRVDSSDFVKEALEISKKFGASSPEARLAWEAVEEMDSSDNRWVHDHVLCTLIYASFVQNEFFHLFLDPTPPYLVKHIFCFCLTARLAREL